MPNIKTLFHRRLFCCCLLISMSCALELSPATPPFSWTKGRGGRSAFRWMTGTKFNLLFKYIYVFWFYGRSTATQGRSCDDWRFFFGLEVTRNRANIDDLAIEWLPGCWHMYLTHRPTDQLTDCVTDRGYLLANYSNSAT